MTNNYSNAYAEVYTILRYLRREDLNKIPMHFINIIKENKNDDYNFTINWNKALKDQNLMVETRAILFNIFRDYLATDMQREKITKIQREVDYRKELEKNEIYSNDIFKRKTVIDNISNNHNSVLVQYKENFFEKLIKKIKKYM